MVLAGLPLLLSLGITAMVVGITAYLMFDIAMHGAHPLLPLLWVAESVQWLRQQPVSIGNSSLTASTDVYSIPHSSRTLLAVSSPVVQMGTYSSKQDTHMEGLYVAFYMAVAVLMVVRQSLKRAAPKNKDPEPAVKRALYEDQAGAPQRRCQCLVMLTQLKGVQESRVPWDHNHSFCTPMFIHAMRKVLAPPLYLRVNVSACVFM